MLPKSLPITACLSLCCCVCHVFRQSAVNIGHEKKDTTLASFLNEAVEIPPACIMEALESFTLTLEQRGAAQRSFSCDRSGRLEEGEGSFTGCWRDERQCCVSRATFTPKKITTSKTFLFCFFLLFPDVNLEHVPSGVSV